MKMSGEEKETTQEEREYREEIAHGREREYPVEQQQPDEYEEAMKEGLKRKFGGGEKTEKSTIDKMMEAMMVRYLMDSMEEHKERKNPPLRVEDISKIVRDLIPKEEKMPEWAKQLQSEQEKIAKHILADEQEKERQKLIKDATDPIVSLLEKERETRTRLEERVKEIEGKPPSIGDGTNPIKYFVDIKKMLEEAGLYKEATAQNIMLGADGMPVKIKGEVPWWIAYGPTIARETVKGIREEILLIAANLISSQTPETSQETKEELIKLPPRPKIPIETPKLVEEPEPTEELIKMPKKPKLEEKPVEEKPPEEPIIRIPEKPKPEEAPMTPAPEATTKEPITDYSKEDIEKLKMAELFAIATQLGVSKKGKKTELIKRILEAKKDEQSESGTQ